MIKSFSHKGLEKFFTTGNKAGIQVKHAKRLSILLGFLDMATNPNDMKLPGLEFHTLKGNLQHSYAVKVSGNWRLVFQFENDDAILVNYIDYH